MAGPKRCSVRYYQTRTHRPGWVFLSEPKITYCHLRSLEGQINFTPRRMHLSLTIPDNPYDPIPIIHASLSVFLLIPGRFHTDTTLPWANITRGYFGYMKAWHTIRFMDTESEEFKKTLCATGRPVPVESLILIIWDKSCLILEHEINCGGSFAEDDVLLLHREIGGREGSSCGF